MLDLKELREKLKKKYDVKDISKKLNLCRVQTSRILNGHAVLSIDRYKILEDMLK